MAGPHPDTFECVACRCDFPASDRILVAGDQMCEDCFRGHYVREYHEALRTETAYPVRYGLATLNINDYTRFFTPQFLAQWAIRMREYETPIPRRLYCGHDIDNEQAAVCRCGEFLGARIARVNNELHVLVCRGCGGRSCASCGVPLSNQTWREHACEPENEEDRFTEMQRGVDYQLCPHPCCQAPMELRDGCNAVRCHFCHTPYCYICGEPAGHNSDHWIAVKPCSRWNSPRNARATHDRPLLRYIPALIADVRRVAATPAGQLRRLDEATLRRIPDLVTAEFFLMKGRKARAQQLSRVMELRDLLLCNMEIYVDHLTRPILPGERRYRVLPQVQLDVNRIRQLQTIVSQETWVDFPQLRRILNTFLVAWEDRQDIVAMLREQDQ